MKGWMIAIIIVVVIVVLCVCIVRHIKNKIRNKIIDKGAEAIAKTTESVLDEGAASVVNGITSTAAEALKSGGGTIGLIKTAAKVGEKALKKPRSKPTAE